MSAPAELVTACIYWVLAEAKAKDDGPLSEEEVSGRVKAMTAAQVREARALEASA